MMVAATTTTRRKDTPYDAFLDHLRDRRLPPVLEVVLSWIVVFALAFYYGFEYYYYCCYVLLSTTTAENRSSFRLPLVTTESKSTTTTPESERSPQDLHHELVQSLVEKVSRDDHEKDEDDDDSSPSSSFDRQESGQQQQQQQQQLVALLRGNIHLRRLATQFVASVQKQKQQDDDNNNNDDDNATLMSLPPSVLELYHRLEDIWLELLRLPGPSEEENETEKNNNNNNNNNDRQHDISLIVPVFRERGSTVAAALRAALDGCHSPQNVQVVVVDAGGCDGLRDAMTTTLLLTAAAAAEEEENEEKATTTTTTTTTTRSKTERRCWSEVKVVEYNPPCDSSSSSSSNGSGGSHDHRTGGSSSSGGGGRSRGGGGRGQTLNFGATCSNGRILVFLHSDCLLPEDWDGRIQTALRIDSKGPIRVQACAFRMGVDTSGLQSSSSNNNNGNGHTTDNNNNIPANYYPWGVGAVQLLANVRTRYFKMPYGDQTISMPASFFRYIGGFPNQPIMEDYSLMEMLRQRASVLPERLDVIPGPPCLGSARRWQRAGVVYVTLSNALLVHRYTQQGWTADDVFEYYYRRPYRNKKEE